jgi:O-antigen/teichoic acid export membrane protein
VTKNDHSSERRIALNAGSQYVALGLSMVVTFFMTPYLLLTVGKEHYSLLVIAFQSTLLLSVASRAITEGFNRFAATDYARGDYAAMNSTVSAGLALSLVSAAVLGAAAAMVALFVDVLFGLTPDVIFTARILIAITACDAVVRLVMRVWLTPEYITQRFYFQSITTIIYLVVLVPVTVFMFNVYSPSIITWITLKCGILMVVTWLVQRPLCRHALPELAPSLRLVKSWNQLKSLASFSGMGSLGQLAVLLFYTCDSIIISNLDELGIAMIAYYNVAQRWDPQIRSLLLAFVKVLTPMLASDFALGNLDRVRNSFIRAVRYCFVLALYPCLCLIILATPMMTHWLPPGYAEVCAPLLRLILTGFIAGVPGYVGYEVLIGSGRIGKPMLFNFACAVGNIVLSVFLVKFVGLGLEGVAMGSVSMLILSNGLATPYMACRISGLSVGRFVRETYPRPFLGAIPLVICACTILQFWDAQNLLIVFAQFVVCGIVYAASVWAISLTSADRTKVIDAISATASRFRAVYGKTTNAK